MTTIAWDGKTLAADRMLTDGTFKGEVTKIWKTEIGLIGTSGSACYGPAAKNWLLKGDKEAPYPQGESDDEKACLIHVGLDGKVDLYFSCAEPVRVENKFYAIGSGRDFALAAMYLGHSAGYAIAVAAVLDTNTGMGMDALTLEA